MTWNSGPFDTEIDHDFDIIVPSEHLTCVNIVCTLVKIKIKIKTFALLNQNPKIVQNVVTVHIFSVEQIIEGSTFLSDINNVQKRPTFRHPRQVLVIMKLGSKSVYSKFIFIH